ncbi:uracil-DNA glycosylase, partial [Ascoidea rubescens DSM 1968]
FDKESWVNSLTPQQKELLELEINTIELSWLELLHKEFTKSYFLTLKRFLNSEYRSGKIVFPPKNDIYSWTRLTPLSEVKVLILGQDPYHNFNQAHGLAFSVKKPTLPPPSLKNMYKCLQIDYPNFVIPSGSNLTGDLTPWANQGVLMLNTCLTVRAHMANSHSKKGWEMFTETVIKNLLHYKNQFENQGIVILAWGSPAQKRIEGIGFKRINSNNQNLLLKSVHPSPLSAARGFFTCKHFKLCNDWLSLHSDEGKIIDWALVPGNTLITK